VGCHAYFREGPYRGNLLTHRVKFNPHLHISQMFEILAQAVQKPPADFPRIDQVPSPARAPSKRFRPDAAELAGVRLILETAGAGSAGKVILLNSNISDREAIPLRKWPDECYVELAGLILSGMPDAFVLLTGTKKEAGSVARLEAAVGQARCRSVAGKTTLRELLTLYSVSAVMVTNDSGPAHFAAMTDMDVVVLFGPETPQLWRPLGERVTVMYRGLACSPCFTVYNGRQSACRRNACMEFTPREVFEVVRQRLTSCIS
jgi:ADP-heptose:LPS heptosyltransferase